MSEEENRGSLFDIDKERKGRAYFSGCSWRGSWPEIEGLNEKKANENRMAMEKRCLGKNMGMDKKDMESSNYNIYLACYGLHY